ncbi:hypothetical protein, partial [Gemmiger sp.]
PHNFPEVDASGKEMLKQEMLYEVQLWGCVSALLGLPAELIPHSWRRLEAFVFRALLTTPFIIANRFSNVKRFFEIIFGFF